MVDFELAEFSLLKEMGGWTRDRTTNSRFEQRVFADWEKALAWARAAFDGASPASER